MSFNIFFSYEDSLSLIDKIEEKFMYYRDIKELSKKFLVKYIFDNKGVMYVLECNVYIVKVYNDKKYCVILYLEICLCLLLIKCYYNFVVGMFVGFLVDVDNCEVSLRMFCKRSLKRIDKKL